MLCRHWLWCLALAASGALMAGCASAPRHSQGSTGDTASARKREQAGERAAAKAAQAHAHYAAGVIHEMNEEREAAAREFYQAALQDPGDVGMILEATRFLLENKQTDKALEVAERAAAQPNATGEIYARLGLIYSQLGKNDQAIAANRTAIQRSPDSLAGYQNLFLIHLRGKQPREALKVLDEAAARPKPHPDLALLALERLGVLPGEAVLVGDAAVDVLMARAAGMRSIAVTCGSQPEAALRAAGPTWNARSVGELFSLLARVA
jgi:phosphoglycolate phosphatase-like HAD superfamily hydrolase